MSEEPFWLTLAGYAKSAIDGWQIKGIIASAGASYATISGGDPSLVGYVFMLFMADFFFGIWEAIASHSWTPYRLHKGAMKLLAYALTILLVMMLADAVNQSVGTNLHICDFFASYLIACEAISIIRHMDRLGLPVPRLAQKIAFGVQEKAESALDKAVGR